MLKNRSKLLWLLAIGTLICLVNSKTQAQLMPFAPEPFEAGFEWFAPAEGPEYGGEPQANSGFFFSVERLNWNLSQPERNVVGTDTATSLDYLILYPLDPELPPAAQIEPFEIELGPASIRTAVPQARGGWANRFEMGWMHENRGWLLGIISGYKQNQFQSYGMSAAQEAALQEDDPTFVAPPSVFIPIHDPGGTLMGIDFFTTEEAAALVEVGNAAIAALLEANPDATPEEQRQAYIDATAFMQQFDEPYFLPPWFTRLSTRNIATLSSVELMYQHRFKPYHNGSFFEMFYGARFLKFRDNFMLNGIGGEYPDATWDSLAENVMIGGQIGGRWFCKKNRWTFATEGRFLAAANFQNLSLNGNFGSLVDPGGPFNPDDPQEGWGTAYPNAFNHVNHEVIFSPVAELRLDVRYQFTRAVSFKLGWTGLYVGNVARGSSNIDYTTPSFGIVGNRREKIFANGVNFGVEVNR